MSSDTCDVCEYQVICRGHCAHEHGTKCHGVQSMLDGGKTHGWKKKNQHLKYEKVTFQGKSD